MFSAHFVVQLPQHASGLAAHWRYAYVPVRNKLKVEQPSLRVALDIPGSASVLALL
jgi:hypothetical protein